MKKINRFLRKMPRKYTREEILSVYEFPSSIVKNSVNGKEYKHEYPIWDVSRDSYCVVVRSLFSYEDTVSIYSDCQKDCNLQIQNKVFNNVYLQPRFNCVYSDEGITKQKYSNTEVPTIPWKSSIRNVRDFIHSSYGFRGNGCLVNGYLTGDHYVDYHRDRELRDGRNSVVTVSIGGSRVFSFMDIASGNLSPPIWLHNGDLVYFYGGTNTHYKHSIIKPLYGTDERPRYSLTFRIIDIL